MTKIILFCLFLSLFISLVSAVEISTNAKLVGDTYYVGRGEKIDINIFGTPSEEIAVSIYYTFILKSSEEKYYFSQNKFPIPISSNFEVKAYPVKNLTVEAKLWIFKKKLSAEAKNDVAIVKAEVPAGKYDVQFYGLSNGDYVTIESLATSKIVLDDKGKFSISYDTSYLPEGEMIVQVDSKLLKVKIIGVSVSPTTPVSYNPPLNNTTEVIPEAKQHVSVEIYPSKANITLNDTLEMTVIVKDSLGQPIVGLAVFWTVNGSAVELLNSENKTDPFGKATAKILAVSIGEATIKAEITDLNASKLAMISVHEKILPVTPTPLKTVYNPPNETLVVNNTSKNTKNQERGIIPGFDLFAALLSIIAVFLVLRERKG